MRSAPIDWVSFGATALWSSRVMRLPAGKDASVGSTGDADASLYSMMHRVMSDENSKEHRSLLIR